MELENLSKRELIQVIKELMKEIRELKREIGYEHNKIRHLRFLMIFPFDRELHPQDFAS